MANRKQRRYNKEKYADEYEQSTKSILMTIAIVLMIFGMFYVLTLAINNSKRKLNTVIPSKEAAKIQYDEILGDDTFTIDKDEYYVLFYDFDGPSAVYYEYLFAQYKSIEGNNIYKVNLANGFNKKFISEETNSEASEAGELKVKDATLIRIEYGENVNYVEGGSQIIAKELS